MNCFTHTDRVALGICRACSKGLCKECAVDLTHSISCKGACAEKAAVLHRQVQQSSVVLSTQSKNRYIMPVFFIFMGLMMMYFARDEHTFFSFGPMVGLVFIVFGAVFALLANRYKKELDGNG